MVAQPENIDVCADFAYVSRGVVQDEIWRVIDGGDGDFEYPCDFCVAVLVDPNQVDAFDALGAEAEFAVMEWETEIMGVSCILGFNYGD
jgi:hypothetical protein